MRGIVLAVALVVTACSSSTTPQAQSSPSIATPSPAELRGDLPLQDLSYTPREFHGGFLHFPGESFTRDSRADMVVDSTRTWLRRTIVQPALFGSSVGNEMSGTITYDAAAGRWLPAAGAQVSPDGLRYAYTEWILSTASAFGPTPIGGRIHVVDVRSGSDQVLYSFDGQAYYGVVGFAQEGIFFSPGCVFGTAGAFCGPEALKLWLLDPTTGKATKVSDLQGSWRIAGGFAWMFPTEGVGDQPNELLRISLSTGSSETWDREPITPHQAGTYGWYMRFVGTDSGGAPLVVVPGTNETPLLRVSRPGQTERIFSGPGCCSDAVADRFGIWFAVGGAFYFQTATIPPSAQAIYLYTGPSGMRMVSDFVGAPVGTLG
jgi:hypothetical protein